MYAKPGSRVIQWCHSNLEFDWGSFTQIPLHLFITTGIRSKITDNFVKVEQKRAPGPSVMSYKRLQQWDAATKTILDTIFQRDRVNGIISSWLMEVKLIRLHKYIEGIKWNWWKCWPEEKRHKRKFRSNSQQIRMLELLSCDCGVRKCLFIKLVMLSLVNKTNKQTKNNNISFRRTLTSFLSFAINLKMACSSLAEFVL